MKPYFHKIATAFDRWKIYCISLLILLFYLRLALPQYVKYILFPFLAITGISAFIHFIVNFHSKWKKFDYRIFYPLILLSLIYVAAFILTTDKQQMLYRDFVNVFAVFIFFFSILVWIDSPKALSSALSLFRKSVIISGTAISFLGLVKLFCELNGFKFELLKVTGLGYPGGSSLAVDNNFFALICLFGIIFMIPGLFEKKSLRLRIITQISLLILIFNIFLSTSRRGIIIAYIILFIFILIWILSVIFKRERLRNFRHNSLAFGIFSFILISLIVYVVTFLSPMQRNKLISYSGMKVNESRTFVSMMSMSAGSIFKGDIKYQDVNSELWQSIFDPYFPYSGWAAGNYIPVSDLPPENVEIVPAGAVGAKINRTSSTYVRNGNAYYVSRCFSGRVDSLQRYYASLYCYVSPDFNGDLVRLSSHEQVKGFTACSYDLSNKGKWQKLETSFYADSGIFTTHFYVIKNNAASLDSLTGFAIFAYPELKKVQFNPKNIESWAGAPYEKIAELPGSNADILPKGAVAMRIKEYAFINKENSQYAISNFFCLRRNTSGKRAVISAYVFASDDFNGDDVSLGVMGKYNGEGLFRTKYNLKNRGKWEKLTLSVSLKDNDVRINGFVKKSSAEQTDSLKGYVLFASPDLHIMDFDSRYPETWADRKYREVKEFSGDNSGIVPSGSTGYLLDSESEYDHSNVSGKDFFSTELPKVHVVSGNMYASSVYCYVSKDFNGSNVKLGVHGSISGIKNAFYGLDKKGSWQKLELNFTGKSGSFQPFLYAELPRMINPENLKGYIVFVHPSTHEYKPAKNGNPGVSEGSLLSFLEIFSSQDQSDSMQVDPDFRLKMSNDNFSGPRLDRWRFAFYIYKNDYNLRQKLIGGEFVYTRKFAKVFFGGERDFDYPHNPMLSVLLYSGIIGLIAYLWYLLAAIKYYWKYRKEYWTLGLCFSVAFFFAIFSSNTPFDPAIFGVLTIIPYFIHYHKTTKAEPAS